MPFLENNSFEGLLKEVTAHHEHQKPFALFKYPDERRVKAIFQQDNELMVSSGLTSSGFVFGPFGDDMPLVVLRSDRTASADLKTEEATEAGISIPEPSRLEAEAYKRKVALAVDTIRAGALSKVVLSRCFEVTTTKSPTEAFRGLVNQYPSAFCYSWYHPQVGCWVGATPETLLNFSGRRFNTHSLAGTQRKEGNTEPQWGQKEKEEQQMVTDYILTVLSGKGIAAERSAVETVEAGSLWHLKTTISGELAPGQVASLVRALHPTPAVCGIPLDKARAFLEQHEGYPRRYYTGFLGEMDLERGGHTRLFVNLRCAELSGSRAHIYVGGGITADSDPDREWEETQAKSRTVLRVL